MARHALIARVILLGDIGVAARYVGLAKKWARMSYRMGVLSNTWRVTEEVTVRVDNHLGANSARIMIEAGGPMGYQFWGSGPLLYKDFEDPNRPGRYLPRGSSVFAMMIAQPVQETVKIVARALESSVWPTPAEGGWRYRENPYQSDQYWQIAPAHQPDGVGHKVWTSAQARRPWLITGWSEAGPSYRFYGHSGGAVGSRTQLADTGYDFAPRVFRSTRGREQAPEADWYRGAGLQRVTSLFGTRTYVVMVDVNHVFYAWPLGQAEAEPFASSYPGYKSNIPPEVSKSRACPWPAWVVLPTVGREHPDSADPRYVWEFSPLGDKAACVALAREVPWADANTSSQWYDRAYVPPDSAELAEEYPGVVEVGFSITMTGSNPQDFTFTCSLLQALSSRDDGRGYLAVGYAVRGDLAAGVAYNALLVLEHRYYLGTRWVSAEEQKTTGVTLGTIMAGLSIPMNPPVCAVAVVMCGETEVMRWLSAYVCRFAEFCKHQLTTNPNYARNSPFRPRMPELSDFVDTRYANQRCFIQTSISGLDLSTLTFALTTTLVIESNKFSTSVYRLVEGELMEVAAIRHPAHAEAAMVTIYALGVLQTQNVVGHPDLVAYLPPYLIFDHEWFTLAAMWEINLKATIDYSRNDYGAVWDDPPTTVADPYADITVVSTPKFITAWTEEFFQYELPGDPAPPGGADLYDIARYSAFAEVTYHDGFGGTDSRDCFGVSGVTWAFKALTGGRLYAYQPGVLANLYSDPELTVLTEPTVFLYFDSYYALRPGSTRWTFPSPKGITDYEGVAEEPIADSLSFTGYPLGAVLHSRLASSVLNPLLNNQYALPRTAPNGSHALFLGPLAVRTTLQHMDAPDGITGMAQQLVDRVHLVIESTDGVDVLTADTTHVDLLNQAFNTEFALTDYEFNLSAPDGDVWVTPASIDPVAQEAYRVGGLDEAGKTVYGAEVFNECANMHPVGIGLIKQGVFHTDLSTFWTSVQTFEPDFLDHPDFIASLTFPSARMESVFTALPTRQEP